MKKFLIVNPRAGKSKAYATIGDSECLGFYNFLKLCGYKGDYLKPVELEDNRCITIEDIKDINSYDLIFLYNFTPNFYGGVEDSFLVNCYKLLAKYDMPIYYLLVDMGIFFSQLSEKLLNKGWESLKDCTKDDIIIKDLVYISQGRDINKVKKLAYKKCNEVSDVVYFPLQFMSIFNEDKLNLVYTYAMSTYLNNYSYDLYYGGSYRSGKRDEQFKEYFFNRNIKTGFFGTISKKDFNGEFVSEPDFNGKVSQLNIIDENKKGFATIILSEKDYNNNIVTLRVFESLLANMVVFIDNDLDTERFIFKDLDYFYVNNGKELEEKIIFIKNNEKAWLKALTRQKQEFFRHFNLEELKKNFKNNIIKE